MEWLLSSYLSSSYRGEEAEKNAKQTSATTIFFVKGCFSDWAPSRSRSEAGQREDARCGGDIFGGSWVIGAYLMSAVGVFSAAVIAPLLALVVAISVA